MRILFRPEARAEVLEAQTWYESRAVGLGLGGGQGGGWGNAPSYDEPPF